MKRRAKILLRSFFLAAVLLIGYLGYLMLINDTAKVESVAGRRQREMTLYELKGTVYDHKLNPITNAEKCYYLLIDPRSFPRSECAEIAEVCSLEVKALSERLESESPFLLTSAVRPQETVGVYVFEGVKRYTGIANHLLGYINSDLVGVTGLEKSYNQILSFFGESKKISYYVDGRNNPLIGLGLSPEGTSDGIANGVITTLDIELQKALEDAMNEYIKTGAAVVLDIQSGEIRAIASRPDYDVMSITKYLNSEKGELIDRSLRSQTVGSVFKIVVAAAALENGLSDFAFSCDGNIQIGDRSFSCPIENGHGEQTMEEAFACSCNGYFIALGQLLGGDKILDMAKRLGFGESMQIASGMYASAGQLPDLTGNSAKQLANFSIGQGDLMASPLQIARLAAACGNGGYLVSPSCFQGFYVDHQIKSEQWMTVRERVFSQEIAERLRQMCVLTVENGTGTQAKPSVGGAGGKTSSAQTGIFDKAGKEVLNTYFAGFFPAEKPQYAIAVFAENGVSGAKTCAPVFRAVCESVLLKKD